MYTIKDIDVYVITHNRSHYLREAIDSLLAQTVRPDVITVFDNESVDDTEEVVRGYANKGVRYVRTHGADGNFFAMQKKVRRPYIVHFHDDNLIHPEYFERVLQALNSIDNVAGVTGAYTYFSTEEDLRACFWNLTHLINSFLIIEDYRQFAIHKVRSEARPYDVLVDNIGALVYRTSYFTKRVPMVWKYGKADDLDVCFELLKRGRLVTISDRNSVYVRNHPKRDAYTDDNSQTLDQALNWANAYLMGAESNCREDFWRYFVEMIFVQYPYFVRRSIYRELPTMGFLRRLFEGRKFPEVAMKVFREYEVAQAQLEVARNAEVATQSHESNMMKALGLNDVSVHFRDDSRGNPLKNAIRALIPYGFVRGFQWEVNNPVRIAGTVPFRRKVRTFLKCVLPYGIIRCEQKIRYGF